MVYYFGLPNTIVLKGYTNSSKSNGEKFNVHGSLKLQIVFAWFILIFLFSYVIVHIWSLELFLSWYQMLVSGSQRRRRGRSSWRISASRLATARATRPPSTSSPAEVAASRAQVLGTVVYEAEVISSYHNV